MAHSIAYPKTELLVGGATLTVLESSNTHGYRSPSASANARVRADRGGFDGSEAVAIRRGYRAPSSMRQRFGGILNTDSLSWSPQGLDFTANGPLVRTQEPTGIEDLTLVPHGPDDPPTSERYAVAFINASDGTIVTGLLALCGITAVNIVDTGTMFATLAPSTQSRYAVRLASDQAPWALIEEIDRITGCKTFDGPDGRVTRIVASGLPGDAPARTYAQGADFKDGATRERSSEGVYNKVTVTGQSGILADGTPYSITASRTKASPYVPNPPGTREYTFHSDLIETEELAGAVAARLLADLGRRRETVTLPLTKGDPNVYVGMTIAVVSAALGLDAATLYRCMEVRDSDGGRGYQTTIVLEGAAAAEGTDPNQGPVLFVTYEIEDERDDDGNPIAVVALDSSASYGPSSPIVLREWDGTPTAPTPLGDGTRASVVYSPLTGTPTVTLTATDANGKVASVTVAIVKTAANTYTRDLWSAEAAILAYSDDGQRTWHEIAVDATVIPEEAGDTYQLTATDTGAAYRIPYSTLAPVALATLASVTALFISRDANGDETGIAWAAASDGRVWRSVDRGVSWAAVAALPNGGRCNAIQESPYASGDVYAGGGNILYHSYGAGASWQAFYTHPNADFLITRLAAGIGAGATDDPADDTPLMWLGFSGPDGTADLRVIERGGTLDHTLPTGEPTPLDITALTISLDAARLFLGDSGDSGRIWTASASASGDLAPASGYPVGDYGVPAHAIRDGRFPIVWGTAENMLWKTPDEGVVYIPVRGIGGGRAGRMVGYGPVRQRIVVGALTSLAGPFDGATWHDDTPHLIRLTATGWVDLGAVPLDTSLDTTRLLKFGPLGGHYLAWNYHISDAPSMDGNEANFVVTTDDGASWQDGGLTGVISVAATDAGELYALAIDPWTSGSRYATVYFSDDDGATWDARATVLHSDTAVVVYHTQIGVHPTDATKVVLKTYAGVVRSADGGVTFEGTTIGPGQGSSNIHTGALLVAGDGVITWTSNEADSHSTIRRLAFGGASATQLTPEALTTIPAIGRYGATLVIGGAVGAGDGVEISANHGAAWTRLATSAQDAVPQTGGGLILVRAGGGDGTPGTPYADMWVRRAADGTETDITDSQVADLGTAYRAWPGSTTD